MAGILDPSLIDAVKGFEGYSASPYWDYRQYTSGYGTRASDPNERIDQATAEQRLSAELSKAADSVDSLGVQMPAGARNALISLTYNAGPGWMQSGLGDLVRAGDWTGARDRLLQYDKAGGQPNGGLAKRRATEAAWFDGMPAAAVASAAPSMSSPQGAPAASAPNPAMFAAAQPGILGGNASSGDDATGGLLGALGGQNSPQMPSMAAHMMPMARRPIDLTALRAMLNQQPRASGWGFA